MNFKNFRQNQIPQKEDLILAEGVSMQSFINSVKKYNTIDDALIHLSDENIEFYLLNINSRELNNLLKKNKIKSLQETCLQETCLQESGITLGMAPHLPASPSEPKQTIFKNLKYKGQYITLEYNPELQSWFPTLRFRSIITALKYIKKQVDYNEKDV